MDLENNRVRLLRGLIYIVAGWSSLMGLREGRRSPCNACDKCYCESGKTVSDFNKKTYGYHIQEMATGLRKTKIHPFLIVILLGEVIWRLL